MYLHFDNAAGGADIQYLATKLVSEVGDGLQVLVLVAECLRGDQLAWVEVLGDISQALCPIALLARFSLALLSDLAVVCQELLKVLGPENVDLGKQQLTLDEWGVGVVQNSPDRHQVLQLPSRLLDNAVLAGEHDGHAGEILNLGAAHDKRIDVEATSGENTGDAGQDTRFVLDQTVENVTLGRSDGRARCLVEDVRYRSLGRPGRRGIAGRERSRAATASLVSHG